MEVMFGCGLSTCGLSTYGLGNSGWNLRSLWAGCFAVPEGYGTIRSPVRTDGSLVILR